MSPESQLMGATPARRAIFPPVKTPSFDRQATSVAATTEPTPLIEARIRKDRRDGGFESVNQARLSVQLSLQKPFKSRARGGGVLVFQRRLLGFGSLSRQNQLLKLSQSWQGLASPLGR
jgi:hypothetical protein